MVTRLGLLVRVSAPPRAISQNPEPSDRMVSSLKVQPAARPVQVPARSATFGATGLAGAPADLPSGRASAVGSCATGGTPLLRGPTVLTRSVRVSGTVYEALLILNS